VNAKAVVTNAIFLFRKKMKVSTAPKARYQIADRKSCLQDLVTLIMSKIVMPQPRNDRDAIFGVQFLNPMPFSGNVFRSIYCVYRHMTSGYGLERGA
jgi:hypothetical protein